MDKALKKKILDLMIEARCMEERMIKMSKSEDGFFWLGGTGEEAFNIPLGLLAKRCPVPMPDDESPLDYDYFHFHYRNGGTMLAMGMDPMDEIRQMHNRATDPFSHGRNFCNHYAWKPWNVAPVASTIQTQWSIAPGTARAQKRHGGEGLTIVTCGDAGTAEGDFHVGLNWASQPGNELPLLFIVTNNEYGISTSFDQVQPTNTIHEKAAAYNIEHDIVDGKDVEASYKKLQEVMAYVRKERKPFMLEAKVSRLYGHSSSSGANRVPKDSESDPLELWANKLAKAKVIGKTYAEDEYKKQSARFVEILKEVKKEAPPKPESIYDHIFKKPINTEV